MKNNRVVYYDILNIIAIISVIALHCNAIVHGSPNTRAWDTSLIVECLFYFAVPVFCMLSGATLMRYREKYDTKTFFRKRVLKVLIPFIFWAIFMFVWKIYVVHSLEEIHSIQEFLNSFFNNKEESTYYFMFNILGIYLTMPILSLLTKKEYRKTLWFTVILYFIFNSFLPNILSLFNINYNSNASILFDGYIIFVILGYLLSTEKTENKYINILIYIGAIIGVIYRYITTFLLSKEAGIVIKTTWGYTSWHSILLTSAVFLLVKNLPIEKIENNKKIVSIISKISSCSFGVYLIHQIVMYYEKTFFDVNSAMWQWRTFGIITTYLISLIIVYILKKIPIIRKIVP